MKSAKTHSKFLIACIALTSVVALLKAGYYKPDFFPIGLTGLNYTGWNSENCPYGNVEDQSENPLWEWDDNQNYPDQTEKALIEALGVNCIGSEDANLRYIGSFDTTVCRNQNNYLYRVCIPSFLDDGDSTNPEHIYIIVLEDITDSLPDSLGLGN